MTIGWIDNSYSYEEAIELSNEAKGHGVILLSSHFKEDFNDFDSSYQVWYGSRASAKTYVKVIQYLYKSSNQKYFRGLFARETKVDVRDSSYQLFEDMITKHYPFLQDEFICEKSRLIIRNTKNGNFMKGASFEKLPRSLADYTDFWVDEPITRKSSIRRVDLLDISGTLRNPFGIKSQKHLTFNPISKDTFIFTDFFGDTKLFESKILLANYQDNVFCPPEKIVELEWYKEIDLQRYLVDSCGEWGFPRVESPYFTTIKDYNLGETFWNKNILKPIWWSWDFNKRASFALAQTYDISEVRSGELNFKHKNRGGICILEEGQYDSVGEHLFKEGVREVIRKFWGHKFIITGDPSGRNTTAGKLSNYQLIQESFEELNYPSFLYEFVGIKRKAFETDISRTVCNAIIGYYAENLVIDRSCKQLWSDLNKIEALSSGKIDKNKMENSNPRYGDHGDCFVGETLIATKEGQKRIDEIKIGDLILTRNGYKKCTDVFSKGVQNVSEYCINNESLICTDNHKIYTKNRGFVEASMLMINDIVCQFGMSETPVHSLVVIDKGTKLVYDITVEEEHEFFANGILVHNCFRYFLEIAESDTFNNLGELSKYIRENE